jgi:glycosyltransferase involved in cell wall biosynthesis
VNATCASVNHDQLADGALCQRPSTSVSIIIPARNDHQRLRRCLEALKKQIEAHGSAELILADNGSSPSLEDIASEFGAVYLACPHGGSYAARNAAIGVATGAVIAFTDADCLPSADWLGRGVTVIHDGSADILAGRVEVFPEDPMAPTAAELYEMAFAFPQQAYVARDGFGVTANLFVRREVFDAIGIFDQVLFSGGDREWGRRATTAGWRLSYHSACVVRHPARRTVPELEQKINRVVQGLYRVDLLGPAGEAEARRRRRQALRPPFGLLWRAWQSCAGRSVRSRLAVLGVLLRLRYRLAKEYGAAARLIGTECAGSPSLVDSRPEVVR